jgi:hypothetical protein
MKKICSEPLRVEANGNKPLQVYHTVVFTLSEFSSVFKALGRRVLEWAGKNR